MSTEWRIGPRVALWAAINLDEAKTVLVLLGGIATAVLAKLAPAAARWFEARTELRKLEIHARQKRADEAEAEAVAIAEVERRSLEDSWNSVERRNTTLDRYFKRMLREQTEEIKSLRTEVTRLSAKVERLSEIEKRCEEAEAECRRLHEENRGLRDALRTAGIAIPGPAA